MKSVAPLFGQLLLNINLLMFKKLNGIDCSGRSKLNALWRNELKPNLPFLVAGILFRMLLWRKKSKCMFYLFLYKIC
jgi:hypothetical protein